MRRARVESRSRDDDSSDSSLELLKVLCDLGCGLLGGAFLLLVLGIVLLGRMAL